MFETKASRKVKELQHGSRLMQASHCLSRSLKLGQRGPSKLCVISWRLRRWKSWNYIRKRCTYPKTLSSNQSVSQPPGLGLWWWNLGRAYWGSFENIPITRGNHINWELSTRPFHWYSIWFGLPLKMTKLCSSPVLPPNSKDVKPLKTGTNLCYVVKCQRHYPILFFCDTLCLNQN